MSWRASGYVKRLRLNLTRSEKFLLLCLADYYDEERACAWPSVATLAADALMSERQARSCIGRLEASGYLHVVRIPGRISLYQLPGLDSGAIPAVVQNPAEVVQFLHLPLTRSCLK